MEGVCPWGGYARATDVGCEAAAAWEIPNLSPFCVKVETYLRMAGLPHEIVAANPLQGGPKGKRPFIEDDGRRILVNILWCPIESPLEEHPSRLGNLAAFCERVSGRYYPRPVPRAGTGQA